MGFPILSSVGRLVRYHLGSVAFGSFIIALVKLIRIIMKFVEWLLTRKDTGAVGKATEVCLKVCSCCMWCLEKILKYLNKNAYIEIGMLLL